MLGRTRKDVWSDARFERHVELIERLINKQRQNDVTVNDVERLLNKQQRQQGVTTTDELMERLLTKQQRQQDVTVNDELINKQQRQQGVTVNVELMERLLNQQQRRNGVTVNDVDERTRRLSEKCDVKDENKSCDVDERLVEESYQTCDAESVKCRLGNRKSVALVVDPKRDVIVADVSDSSDAHPLRHAAMNAIDAVAHAQVLIDNLV
jgi:hypothetical protein